jgi:hypothetical protein
MLLGDPSDRRCRETDTAQRCVLSMVCAYLELDAEIARLQSKSTTCSAATLAYEQRIAEAMDRMYELANDIAATPSTGNLELKAKARVVKSWLRDNEPDLATSLTLSLCDEMLANL